MICFKSKHFRDIVFQEKPDILLGAVHYGEGLRHHVYRRRLEECSKTASFYTFHTNNYDDVWNNKLSSVPAGTTIQYAQDNIAEVKFRVDLRRKYWFSR